MSRIRSAEKRLAVAQLTAWEKITSASSQGAGVYLSAADARALDWGNFHVCEDDNDGGNWLLARPPQTTKESP